MASFNGKAVYDLIKKVYDIQAFPKGEEFLKGLNFVSKVGLTIFGWNIAMFGISGFAFGPFLFIIGLIDVALVALLLLGIRSQLSYLPLSSSPCAYAENWRNGTDGRNIFVEANRRSPDKSPNEICSEAVASMKWTIAIIALYFLCALVNLIIGTLTCTSHHIHIVDCGCCRYFEVIFHPLVIIKRATSAGVRYTSRYLSKLLRRYHSRDMGFKTQDEYPLEGADFQVELTQNASQNSSTRLHFIDAVQSKLTPVEQRAEGMSVEELRRFTCNEASKSECRICRIQICRSCSSTLRVASSVASAHLKTCTPYCTSCFYAYYCRSDGRRGRTRKVHSYQCQLAKGTVRPHQLEGVCRQCASKTQEERQEVIELQDRREVYRLAQHPLACFRCKQMLPQSGPRWWVCSACNIECLDHIHPPWASKL
ncbi:hypothetical protein McanMca71_003629 [Microsporum canis]